MIAEILCVGSELLLGDTVNTNASYISQKLVALGINCFYQSTVGDNPARIQEQFDIAFNRADFIIVTGGLGPTEDDLTIKAIADYFDTELVFNEEVFNGIKTFFDKLNRVMPETNRKQACIPKGAVTVNNPEGTAPGIIWKIPPNTKNNAKEKIILAFPGVPNELYVIWEESIHKFLKQYSSETLFTRFLKFFGIPEAALAEKVHDLLGQHNPTVASLVANWESKLRIAAKAKTKKEAERLILQTEKEILSRVGEYFYGYDDTDLETAVGKLLLERKLTVATAESCTGGLISSRLTDVSGSSAYILQNIITYSNEAKINTIGVDREVIEKFGAVSEQTAEDMAKGVRSFSNSDIGLGITGIAGPTGGTATKPVGLVYIGINSKQHCEVHELRIPSNLSRKEIKFIASQYALNYLRLFIQRLP